MIDASWRKTTVTIEDDDRPFEAYDVRTTWNGFTDYAVTEEVWALIRARLVDLGMPLDDTDAAEFAAYEGIVHLGGGAFVILSEVAICPECPRNGAGRPHLLEPTDDGKTCPNCGRWWSD